MVASLLLKGLRNNYEILREAFGVNVCLRKIQKPGREAGEKINKGIEVGEGGRRLQLHHCEGDRPKGVCFNIRPPFQVSAHLIHSP